MLSFKGMRFPIDVMLVCIRWYVAYPLSYRHIEEMMREWGVSVDHSSINRWAIRFLPLIEKIARLPSANARRRAPAWRIVSFSLYAAMLLTLYLTSSLYHGVRGTAKDVPRKMDQCAIYLLIAGSFIDAWEYGPAAQAPVAHLLRVLREQAYGPAAQVLQIDQGEGRVRKSGASRWTCRALPKATGSINCALPWLVVSGEGGGVAMARKHVVEALLVLRDGASFEEIYIVGGQKME